MTQFVTLTDALHIVERLGFHVRDAGLLASALARPATSVNGADAYPDLGSKAATLLESITRNHPLVDGNKRTAWTVMVTFLWLNGYTHTFTVDAAFDLVVGVASGSVPLATSAGTIAKNIAPRSAL